ncbi:MULTISPECIES: hypothetical protein [unclassified Streptomyces]|uniref:hypothetical protein n=1 Tax=unclassified Streptomyces TaxID=2593676 RepID=UPI00224D8604|nr:MULTISPECIES: hypothetical protein [unclassified Streptomyces]MCX4871109.1 hypothetical protein [Streptomyces sp. NBC_00906]MCX4902731.1 hypothetical protein [Streptomyces sp. NBC_00892]
MNIARDEVSSSSTLSPEATTELLTRTVGAGRGPRTGEWSSVTMSTSGELYKDAIPSDLDRWAPHEITQWLADVEADEEVSEDHVRRARQAVHTALGLDD